MKSDYEKFIRCDDRRAMKKYWVITRREDDNTFVAFPADDSTVDRVIDIATLGERGRAYWVAEQTIWKPAIKEEMNAHR